MTARLPAGVVVVDLDDTLYLERDYVLSGIAAVGDRLRIEGTPGFAAVAAQLFGEGRRGDIFDAALVRLGVEPTPETIARLVALYRGHLPDIALQPDAPPFLDTVARTYGLALVTDGHLAVQRHKIAALGLARWPFAPLICTDIRGRAFWKPHRAAFDEVAAAHDLDASSFVYVADNPAKDFLAPRALGWRTVQIDRPGRIHPATPPEASYAADLVVASLAELAPRLSMLLGARDRPHVAAAMSPGG